MTHEIRTPLNGLLGMLQVLQTTRLDGEQADCLGAAVRSGQRLTDLLGDILDLSRIEAGQMPLRQAPFSFRDIFLALNDLFLPSCLQDGTVLDLALHPSARGRLAGDEPRVRQVLFNLVSNAVKFSRGGEVGVSVSCLPAARPGQVWAVMEVRDAGVGIPEDRVDSIFNAFSQVEGDSARRFQGAGLGLAIVGKLVEMMHGSINIESTVGAGTLVEAALLLKAEGAA
jgi:two-component system sensor histidine kinase EvgS